MFPIFIVLIGGGTRSFFFFWGIDADESCVSSFLPFPPSSQINFERFKNKAQFSYFDEVSSEKFNVVDFGPVTFQGPDDGWYLLLNCANGVVFCSSKT